MNVESKKYMHLNGDKEIDVYETIAAIDAQVGEALRDELDRQETHIELIASENFVVPEVLAAAGSVLTNKYAEGYPGKRYYGGCQFVDVAEEIARDRIKTIFGAEHANVQPHSGSQANMAVYLGLLNHGDTIMGMDLSHGGHLTHGHPLNFSGLSFNVVTYEVDRESETIDYEQLAEKARAHKPRMIVAGASAYSRVLDFEKFAAIAKDVGALLMVDMAHIAGLIAAGLHPNPVPHADVVTSTTHKTLRGPRGGFILCREQYAAAIDRALFPGVQGGPLMHVIAAKAVAFGLAQRPEFKVYQQAVIDNAKRLARSLEDRGFRIVSGGTDNHLMLVDTFIKGKTGRAVEKRLDNVGITVNKNTIPFDQNKPMVASGIRVGTPAVTTRGMGFAEMDQIAAWIDEAIQLDKEDARLEGILSEVKELTARYPIYRRTS